MTQCEVEQPRGDPLSIILETMFDNKEHIPDGVYATVMKNIMYLGLENEDLMNEGFERDMDERASGCMSLCVTPGS